MMGSSEVTRRAPMPSAGAGITGRR